MGLGSAGGISFAAAAAAAAAAGSRAVDSEGLSGGQGEEVSADSAILILDIGVGDEYLS